MLRILFISVIIFASLSTKAQDFSRWVLKGYEQLHTDSTIVHKKLSSNLFTALDTVNLKYGRIDSLGNVVVPIIYEVLGDDLSGFILASKGSNYGYIDNQGKTLIPFEYMLAYPFTNGKAIVTKNYGNNFGVINENNEEVIPLKYFRLGTHDSNIFSFQLGEGKAGIMDVNEKILVNPEFNWVKKIGNGYWNAVNTYGRDSITMTVFNPDGSLLEENEFEYVKQIHTYDLIEGKVGDKIGFWDFDFNNVIPPIYDERPFGFYGHIGKLMIIKKGDYYGFIDSIGTTIVPFEFSKVSKTGRQHCILKRGEKFNVVDQYGNILLEEDKTSVEKISDANLFVIDGDLYNKNFELIFDAIQSVQTEFYEEAIGLLKVSRDDKIGYIDSLGNIVIPLIYEEGKRFHRNGVTAVKKEGKWGFINSNQKELSKFIFDEVKHSGVPPRDCEYIVKKGEFYGYFKSDTLVVASEYEGFDLFKGENSLIYKEGDKYGIIDYGQGLKLEAKYDEIMPKFVCYNVEIDKKIGVVDLKLKEVIPPKYDALKTHEYFNVVMLDNKHGTISHTGEIIEPLIYDSYEDGWVSGRGSIRKISKEGKYGIIGNYGTLIIPAIYDDIKRLDYHENVELSLNGKLEVVNLDELELEKKK